MKTKIKSIIENRPTRSCWAKGVKAYALELLETESLDFSNLNLLQKSLLNGAYNWLHYAESGCGLVYDSDIAERLCSPSELKRVRGGLRRPNKTESWLDVEARALFQAWGMIRGAYLRIRPSKS